jgi:hypothetical protein
MGAERRGGAVGTRTSPGRRAALRRDQARLLDRGRRQIEPVAAVAPRSRRAESAPCAATTSDRPAPGPSSSRGRGRGDAARRRPLPLRVRGGPVIETAAFRLVGHRSDAGTGASARQRRPATPRRGGSGQWTSRNQPITSRSPQHRDHREPEDDLGDPQGRARRSRSTFTARSASAGMSFVCTAGWRSALDRQVDGSGGAVSRSWRPTPPRGTRGRSCCLAPSRSQGSRSSRSSSRSVPRTPTVDVRAVVPVRTRCSACSPPLRCRTARLSPG